jgi:hypothetical protein
LTDVENEYDPFLGFKAKLDVLKNECKRLTEERNREIAKLGTIPYLGSTISTLFRKGLTEIDILQIASLFHNYPEFLDVWSNFKAKRAKEGDSQPKPEPEVVKDQNLREEADSDRDSPAPRNRGEPDGDKLEAQGTPPLGRVAHQDEPDVIFPSPYSHDEGNQGKGKFGYPLPPTRIGKRFLSRRSYKMEAKGKAISNADPVIEETESLRNVPTAATSPRHNTKSAHVDPGSQSNLSTQKVPPLTDHESGKKD